MRGKTWGYIWCGVLAVLLVLLLREAWHVTVDHVLVPDWKHLRVSRLVYYYNPLINFNIGLYWWFGVGFVVYPLSRWLFVKLHMAHKYSFTDIETLSHELSHWIVGKFLGRHIHMIRSEEETGEVISSGSQWSRPFMSLAPYTFPFLTFALLALRGIIVPKHAWLFDIIMGITFGMHFVCFITQTHKNQPDINRFSTLWFPYLYIAVCAAFNYAVIMVSFWTGSHKNFFSAIGWVVTSLVEYPMC